ncbi:Ion channel [Amycolatopsis arida]|uniref:Ion channel n=1 Tax=Amycolatopsis arida TaxID=587909 RepID=A0A1I5R0N6_9PSEU|nr:potassium channel family protein [Amycolatopsis arida]TDX99030.1 ion channel [Amycolatopsis arida]SFP52053.1 Ion channel [Amycolatopsis arida]
MELLTWAGLALMAFVVVEAAVTVLHPDAEGLVASGVRRGSWWLATGIGARWPRTRRHLLGLAGPVLVTVTFVSWIALLVLGLAVAAWPLMSEFTAIPALEPLTFADAVYFAGGTVTVLGYGDVTPVSTAAKLLSLAGAAAGFTMFTGMATYVIEVVNGVGARNRFTLALHDDTRTGGGATLVADCLAEGGVDQVRDRCREWAGHLRAVEEIVHRYPLVAFTYRSYRTEYDPEPALRHVAEGAVAALLAAGYRPALRPAAEALASALTRVQCTIADRYLPADVHRRLAEPEPGADDRAAAARIDRMVSVSLGEPGPSSAGESAAEVVFRSHVFLAGLHRWSRMGVASHEWVE